MPQRPALALLFVLVLWQIAGSGCGASNPYNFARSYKPLGPEKSHFKASKAQVSLEQVKRDPNGFRDTELGWFGVVTGMSDRSDGKSRLTLSLRSHQSRHLCRDEAPDSCRVTVSEKDLGTFTIDVQLDDSLAKDQRVWFGSLLRVYGHPSGEYDDEGGPQIDVTYYRHFPRGTYVTTASRGGMRR